jgi:SAM-dependent methyltransferase
MMLWYKVMPEDSVHDRMRADWDRRACEDARYYVAFGRRQQSAEEFFETARDVLHALRFEFRRFAGPPSQLSALEIGCGPGRLLVPLSRDFGSITGVDVSAEMVELARQNLAGSPNARAELASGSDLAAFPDESFDFVYSYAVFQHIPSRPVVLNYLREARRVLRTGGLLKCQLNGLPDRPGRDADTWSGIRFRPVEIREFCRAHDFQLLLLDGLDTQNMWMCARKRPFGWTPVARPARLIRAGNTYTPDLVIPAAGRFASASLWVEGLSADADLNNLEVEIGGCRVPPCYVGRHAAQGPDQVNAFLPPGLPTGLLRARLWMLGEPISGFVPIRIIPAPPAVPRLLEVTDGIDLLSANRTETRTLKVNVEEVGSSPDLAADLDGAPLEHVELFCVDPLSDRYTLNLKVPPEIPAGPHLLHVRLHGRPLPPVPLEVVA